MMEQRPEQRSELRLAMSAAVFVEVQAADWDNELPATVLLCRLLDVSANGIQIRIDRRLREGAILHLCADFGGARPTLRVVGEVRWVRPEDGHYRVGFSLYESDQTDIGPWKELVAQAL